MSALWSDLIPIRGSTIFFISKKLQSSQALSSKDSHTEVPLFDHFPQERMSLAKNSSQTQPCQCWHAIIPRWYTHHFYCIWNAINEQLNLLMSLNTDTNLFIQQIFSECLLWSGTFLGIGAKTKKTQFTVMYNHTYNYLSNGISKSFTENWWEVIPNLKNPSFSDIILLLFHMTITLCCE